MCGYGDDEKWRRRREYGMRSGGGYGKVVVAMCLQSRSLLLSLHAGEFLFLPATRVYPHLLSPRHPLLLPPCILLWRPRQMMKESSQ